MFSEAIGLEPIGLTPKRSSNTYATPRMSSTVAYTLYTMVELNYHFGFTSCDDSNANVCANLTASIRNTVEVDILTALYLKILLLPF